MKTWHWLLLGGIAAYFLFVRKTAAASAAAGGPIAAQPSPLDVGLTQLAIKDPQGNVVGYDWFKLTDDLTAETFGQMGLTTRHTYDTTPFWLKSRPVTFHWPEGQGPGGISSTIKSVENTWMPGATDVYWVEGAWRNKP